VLLGHGETGDGSAQEWRRGQGGVQEQASLLLQHLVKVMKKIGRMKLASTCPSIE
jgi:hypothetical protein